MDSIIFNAHVVFGHRRTEHSICDDCIIECIRVYKSPSVIHLGYRMRA